MFMRKDQNTKRSDVRTDLTLDDTCDIYVLVDFIRTETGLALLANMDCL